MISFSTKLAFIALLSFSYAKPTRRTTSIDAPRFEVLPEGHDVTHIAVDETNGEYVAFRKDWSVYGVVPFDSSKGLNGTTLPVMRRKRDAGVCTDLSVQEAQMIPGWSTMVAQAKANWGGGSYNLATNPPEYLDSPAQACVSQEPVQLAFNGDPNCVTQHQSLDGQETGANGSITLTNTAGFTGSTTNTVNKVTSISQSATLQIKIEFPDFFEFTGSLTTTGTFTNELSNTFQTTIANTATQTVVASAADGKMCHLELDTKSCSAIGKGSLQTTAQGWMWFKFDSQTNGHWNWALLLEGVLPNAADRSSSVDFMSSVQGNSVGNFKAVCN